MNKINTFINTFDFDGVIYMGPDFTGLRPCINDIIITGRPISESKFVLEILSERHINNPIHFNPIPREDPEYSREASGKWKAKVLDQLKQQYMIGLHYEDDEIQSEIIQKIHPDICIVHVQHGQIIEY
jgi:hypothetical protein